MPALDGVRGLAAMGVLAAHLFPGTSHSRAEQGVRFVLDIGGDGVGLFFVLSGFLITGILYDTLHEKRYFRKFYARRALRIFPLYYGVLAAFGIVVWVKHSHLHNQLISLALYLQNTSLIAPPIWHPTNGRLGALGHFWSLALEEQFYLVWPLVIFLVRRRRWLAWICAAFLVLCPFFRVALFLLGDSEKHIRDVILTQADSLLIGALLALLLRSEWRVTTERWSLPALSIAAPLSIILMGLSYFPSLGVWGQIAVFGPRFTTVDIASAALICCAVTVPAMMFAFKWAPLRWVGKYSYGIYVYHLIIFTFLAPTLRTWIGRHVSGNKVLDILLPGLVEVACTFVVAYTSYHLFERHFLRLKRYFDYRPHPNTVSPAASL